MNYTAKRLAVLADAAAAAHGTGLRGPSCGAYRAEWPNATLHMSQVVQPMERDGLLSRFAGDCLHITDLGERTLQMWREQEDLKR